MYLFLTGGTGVKSVKAMAYSTTLLLAGILMGRETYEKTGLMEAMFDCVKWPLDYFIKCHADKRKFYAQVCCVRVINYNKSTKGKGPFLYSAVSSP